MYNNIKLCVVFPLIIFGKQCGKVCDKIHETCALDQFNFPICVCEPGHSRNSLGDCTDNCEDDSFCDVNEVCDMSFKSCKCSENTAMNFDGICTACSPRCHDEEICEYHFGVLTCVCKEGFVKDNFQNCIECGTRCNTKETMLEHNTRCLYDSEISRSVCRCIRGFKEDFRGDCVECHICGVNEICELNYMDEVRCVCQEGYTRINDQCIIQCRENTECERMNGVCHEGICVCKVGHRIVKQLDTFGLTEVCFDADECQTECDRSRNICLNTDDSHICIECAIECPLGFICQNPRSFNDYACRAAKCNEQSNPCGVEGAICKDHDEQPYSCEYCHLKDCGAGKCIDSISHSAVCDCGFSGVHYDYDNNISNDPSLPCRYGCNEQCLNGVCDSNTGICECHQGYIRPEGVWHYCVDRDDCILQECMNGSCVNTQSTYVCQCQEGFEATNNICRPINEPIINCDTKCREGIYCNRIAVEGRCDCVNGYIADDDLSQCVKFCEHDYQCNSGGKNVGKCVRNRCFCNYGYALSDDWTCEELVLSDVVCPEGIASGSGSSFTCVSNPCWTSTHICGPEEACRFNGSGYYCDCSNTEGYESGHGLQSPCQLINGNCFMHLNEYVCECHEDYVLTESLTCEVKKNCDGCDFPAFCVVSHDSTWCDYCRKGEYDDYYCGNGGRCIQDLFSSHFKCDCLFGYVDKSEKHFNRCEGVEIDTVSFCPSNACGPAGECVYTPYLNYTCRCRSNFYNVHGPQSWCFPYRGRCMDDGCTCDSKELIYDPDVGCSASTHFDICPDGDCVLGPINWCMDALHCFKFGYSLQTHACKYDSYDGTTCDNACQPPCHLNERCIWSGSEGICVSHTCPDWIEQTCYGDAPICGWSIHGYECTEQCTQCLDHQICVPLIPEHRCIDEPGLSLDGADFDPCQEIYCFGRQCRRLSHNPQKAECECMEEFHPFIGQSNAANQLICISHICASQPSYCGQGKCIRMGKTADGAMNFRCKCREGFVNKIHGNYTTPCVTKDWCSAVGICGLGSCENKGVTYECNCYGNLIHEIEFDLTSKCIPHPCHESRHICHGRNSEGCRKLSRDYECLCSEGFYHPYVPATAQFNKRRCLSCEHMDICGTSGCTGNSAIDYQCSKCAAGFSLNALGYCEDINECSDPQTCPENSRCENTNGSYECVGLAGYSFDIQSHLFIDVNECRYFPCRSDEYCRNIEGGYICDNCSSVSCDTGYRCIPTTYSITRRYCIDIDECAEEIHLCHHTTTCQNTEGSYKCLCRTEGLHIEVGHICPGIDICDDPSPCRSNLQRPYCYSNADGFFCAVCDFTTIGTCNGTLTCQPTDDGMNAHCVDSCSTRYLCSSGYDCEEGKCREIDECNQNKHLCDTDVSNCKNLEGTYECECHEGYRQNQEEWWKCDDINECATNPCVNADCINMDGGFECKCSRGFKHSRDNHNLCIHDTYNLVAASGAFLGIGGVLISLLFLAFARRKIIIKEPINNNDAENRYLFHNDDEMMPQRNGEYMMHLREEQKL